MACRLHGGSFFKAVLCPTGASHRHAVSTACDTPPSPPPKAVKLVSWCTASAMQVSGACRPQMINLLCDGLSMNQFQLVLLLRRQALSAIWLR